MPKNQRTRMITAALPYANGPLHFGHLAGVYIPADIYFRHSKLLGVDSVYICGSDEHGVAITLNAEKAKIPYQDYVDHWNKDHQRLFALYDIQFTHFGRTTSATHKRIAQKYFKIVHDSGYLKEKKEIQAYCLNDKIFLPDRYLRGTCAKCGYPEARGDECPNCGAWLAFEDLINPYCAVCNKSEIETREVSHWYFDLPRLRPRIREWLESQNKWKENIRNYSLSLLEETPERAITRNVSWGIDLPEPFYEEGKKIYVWFEAPFGYLSNLIEYFEQKGDPDAWKKYWEEPSDLIHFIGKDNIIFHTIIWPGTLMAAGERLPTNVPANMFVMLQKKQFSKSSGWYVDADEMIQKYGVDRVRYYLTTIIPEVHDTNFDWQNFHDKVNSELVNKIANLFNRVGTQIQKHFAGRLEASYFSKLPDLKSYHERLIQHLENFEINPALSVIVELTERANKFLDDTKPWNLLKEDKEKAKPVLAEVSHYMFSVASLLQVFLPGYSNKVLKAFGIAEDDELRSDFYKHSAFEFLKSNGLQISLDANFVIPRLNQEEINKEIQKLEKLKA